MRLIIHAPNVHVGGGLTLLADVLAAVPAGRSAVLIADRRLAPGTSPATIELHQFPGTVVGRLGAERLLRSLVRADDAVLCLGNLPPLFRCAGHVAVFLQNRYLCDAASTRGFPLRARVRFAIERRWLRVRLRPAMRLLVQTPSMQAAARTALSRDAELAPFAALPAPPARQDDGGTPRMLYPASPDPHKRHDVLLEAWRLLHDSGVEAELHLTIPADSDAGRLAERCRVAGVPVVNHGPVTRADLAGLYASCHALIFPSTFESFGLPLLEARHAGLPIIAAERDYVRDVVTPAETFDPDSPVSMARAVRRHLGRPEPPLAPLSPAAFIDMVTEGRWA